MRHILLLILCACAVCPPGTIPANQTSGPVCISDISYCNTDTDCATAKFSCELPCENLPVNAQNLEKAKAKEQLCNRENASCRLSPEIVQTWCEEHLCRTRTLYAEDFVTSPTLLPVTNDSFACSTRDNGNVTLHFFIQNNAPLALETLEGLVVGDTPTSSEAAPYEFALLPLITAPIPKNAQRQISVSVPIALGNPTTLTLYPSQHIFFGNIDAGIVTRRVAPTRIENITRCTTSPFANRRV